MQTLHGTRRDSAESQDDISSSSSYPSIEPLHLDDLIDQAKRGAGIKSDSRLGKFMGFKGFPVSQWRCKRVWPAEATVAKLAELAGRDPVQTMLALKLSSTSGKAREVWEKVAAIVKRSGAAAILGLAFVSCFAGVSEVSARTLAEQGNLGEWQAVYYGKWRRLLRPRHLTAFLKVFHRLRRLSSSRGHRPARAAAPAAAMLPQAA